MNSITGDAVSDTTGADNSTKADFIINKNIILNE